MEGQVDPQGFRELLAGSVAGQVLGRHRADGSLEHHPGWDFAVNAPKSVSIMALVGKDDRVLDLHEHAVGAALGWLEEHAAFRYRKEGGITHETTGRLLFARFTEHASRELDPHLHTHVVVMNITNRADGTPMTSLETRAMFAEQMVAGQVYRNALAHGLRELGYEIDADPRRGLFEIKDVPKKLIQRMSQRAEQINQHAAEHGHVGQAARVRSFYQTRGPKETIGLDDLHAQWRERAGKELASLTQLRQSAGDGERAVFAVEPALASRAALFGLRHCETGEAVNNQGQIIRSGLAAHVGEVRLSDLRPYIQEHEERGKLLAGRHQSGDAILTRARTSRRTVRLELALSNHLALAIGDAPRLGVTREAEFRVVGVGREPNGRPIVRLVDEQGRQIRWDPRLTRATQVNVFNSEQRDLAQGDRIQWRLATKALDLKNAERGTVEQLHGSVATIRWDRTGELREVDLSRYKTWDHGYAETVFSSQSKTYARVYVLAPVASPLVNGQNFYTAITRARFGVKLWTEDAKRLTEKLERRSGEKSSALEALGQLASRKSDALKARLGPHIEDARALRAEGRRDRALDRSARRSEAGPAAAARQAMETLTRLSRSLLKGQAEQADKRPATKQHDLVHQPRKGLER